MKPQLAVRTVAAIIALQAIACPSAAQESSGDCGWGVDIDGTPAQVCTFTGTIDHGTSRPVVQRRPAELWVVAGTDPGVGACWYMTTLPPDPGGLPGLLSPAEFEVWARANLPRCLTDQGVGDVWAEAWMVFQRLPLARPEPELAPPGAGITGLATYLSDLIPEPVVGWSGPLPSGVAAVVEGYLIDIEVVWGDGAIDHYDPEDLAPAPVGTAAHTYTTKTCPADYRETHPRGHLCHPTLEAYPLSVTYTWWGRFLVGGEWTELSTLDLSTSVAYDVDEVIGVLESAVS